MQHPKQTKSKQFYRHATIEPIARSTSFHTIDHRKRDYKPSKMAGRDSSNQNNYDLANIVNQILEMKPKTALLSDEKGRRKIRAETIGNQYSKPERMMNKVNILNMLRGQEEQSHETVKTEAKRKEKRCKMFQVDSKVKHTIETSVTSRANKNKSDELVETNFESVNIPQGFQKQANKQLIPRIQKNEQVWTGQEIQLQHFQRHATDEVLLKKNKLTINNIDKFVSVQLKKQKVKSKHIFKFDLKQSDSKNNIVLSKERSNNEAEMVMIEKKIRKTNDDKVPDFIKASLQGYRQESDYGLNCEKTSNKIAEVTPLHSQESQAKVSEESRQIRMAQKYSQDNLAGAKLRLFEKQKRRTTRIGDYIRGKKDQAQVKQPQQDIPKAKISKMRVKSKHIQDERNHRICGWQQQDLLCEGLSFKD